jgi:dTDP-4-amino-4,6-dideoxygalactose transaminase
MLPASLERKVPFFNYPHVFTQHENEILDIIADVGRRGAFIMQQELRDFEISLAKYVGAKHVLGVANGTDALIIALRAAGIGAGDEVIFCSHTYVATAAAIHLCGATPIPVECGKDHLIDPDSIDKAVTAKTKAIMPTQLNGRTCNMDAIQLIADRHGLLIIEDAAQALGSQFRGRTAGTFGLAGTISFYPAKTLGSLGDAGAILTDDDDLHCRMSQLRDHGRDESGEIACWGLNSRLDNLQAAILSAKLKQYDNDVRRRREISAIYDSQLGNLNNLVLPPAHDSDPDHYDVYQNYEIEAEHRDELIMHLSHIGIGTMVQWGGKVVHQFSALNFKVSLPFSERMISRSLMLPMNTSLSDNDVYYVCDGIKSFYTESLDIPQRIVA